MKKFSNKKLLPRLKHRVDSRYFSLQHGYLFETQIASINTIEWCRKESCCDENNKSWEKKGWSSRLESESGYNFIENSNQIQNCNQTGNQRHHG